MWLIVAVLSAVLVVTGLAGSALTPLLCDEQEPGNRNSLRRFAESTTTPLLAGMLAAFSLLLVLNSFKKTAIALSILAAIGTVRFGWITVRQRRFSVNFRGFVAALPALVVILGIGATALSTPLSSWDSRSIWFFHAKIIASLGGLERAPIWTASAIQFSSVIHPKLLPAIGAIFPTVFDVWNEYLPKAGLLLLAIPGFLTLLCFSSGRKLEWFLLTVFAFNLGAQLSNGMADGYFSLYGAAAILFLGRYFEEHGRSDIIRALLCLGIACSIKSEGLLLVVTTLVTSVIAAFVYKIWPKPNKRLGVAVVLSFIPIILWTVVKKSWGIADQMHLNFGADILSHIMARLSDIPYILHFLIIKAQLWRAGAFAGLTIICGTVFLRRLPPQAALPLVTGMGFLFGLVMFYIGTTADLKWLLEVSAGRTTMVVILLMVSAVYGMLDCLIEKFVELDTEPRCP